MVFSSRDGILYIEDVSALELVKELGTPLYVTSKLQLEENLKAYKEAFPDALVFYSVKANDNLAIMKIIQKQGFGAEVFSSGEIYLALLAGFDSSKIFFNGNSKSPEEIRLAISAGVTFSVDSIEELENISEIAKEEGKVPEIACRINPGVDPKTHPKVATGLRESKFGIPIEQAKEAYKKALELGLKPVGIHFHVGSQILDLSVYEAALTGIFDLPTKLEEMGIELKFINIGGGLGIDYNGSGAPTPKELASRVIPIFREICSKLKKSRPKLHLEPGRSIVGNTTILLTRVNLVKNAFKKFVAVDAGFNLLIRPTLYGSYHRVAVANKMDKPEEEVYTIVGPICESGDILAQDRKLPKVEKGDIITLFDTGAYGFAMSSQYNGRPRCPEVLVSGNKWEIIRERESTSDLLLRQRIPEWLF
ncbi:MAG: diaminopimelate decarboxylase [Synergistetes bacterium]|nr:diaminopimelate decarboxylase [Synergistota bacterium]MDW8191701.1 diaminopimelate decarboxylase [Synergistota bacterium]